MRALTTAKPAYYFARWSLSHRVTEKADLKIIRKTPKFNLKFVNKMMKAMYAAHLLENTTLTSKGPLERTWKDKEICCFCAVSPSGGQ
jgi:hypothetical protein